MNAASPSRDRSEEGASAPLFVVVLSALLAVAMLALDGGSLYWSRSGQVSDTDAAALAVAQRMIDNPCRTDQATIADEYAGSKAGHDSTVTDVSVTPTASGPTGCPVSGIVNVTTTREAQLFFAPVFGFDSVPTSVGSGAVYGDLTALGGVRPMGLCVDDPHYTLEWQPFLAAKRSGVMWGAAEWTAAKTAAETAYRTQRSDLFPPAGSPPLDTDFDVHPTSDKTGTAYPSTAHVHRVTFADDSSADWCGGGPSGHFGWLDFDGDGGGDIPEECESGVTPRSELNCDINTGFGGTIGINPPDCDPTSAETSCLSQPGEVNSASSGLETLRCDASRDASDPACTTIYMIVYDQLSSPASGSSDPQFEIVSVTGLVLRDWRVNSAGPRDPNGNYLDLEFVDEITIGAIGPTSSTSTGPQGVALCRVNQFDNCDYGP